MKQFKEKLMVALIEENPTFVQFLALCPTLGTTSSVTTAFGMGVSVIIVLFFSNTAVSLIRKHIPDNIRISVYITLIATIVVLLELLLETFLPSLYTQLGIYLPLIVVNCIILGRAEAFASQNSVKDSMIDGVTVGIAFATSLVFLGAFREVLGTGTILGFTVLPTEMTMKIFVGNSGVFIAFGLLAWIFNEIQAKNKKKRRQ